MDLPKPKAGLVVNYGYLWLRETVDNRKESAKNRPCAIILTARKDRVVVVPITHSPPRGSEAIELPQAIKRQLGLDYERSWVVINEANDFHWPGYDLAPAPRTGSPVFGQLPPGFLNAIQREVATRAKRGRFSRTNRDV